MIEEQKLIDLFASKGGIMSNNELYLPIQLVDDFVKQCNRLEVAVIGLEFFTLNDSRIKPISPPMTVDLSELINDYNDWEEAFATCNSKVLEIIEKEVLDNSCYFSFVITNSDNK